MAWHQSNAGSIIDYRLHIHIMYSIIYGSILRKQERLKEVLITHH